MGRFANRRAVLAFAIAAVSAAGGTMVYAGIPDSSNVYHACVLNGIGTIRLIDPSLPSTNLLSHCISTKETEIRWNQQGPQGVPGTPGVNGKDGANGKDGMSVTSSSLAIGDVNCPNGGSRFQSASGVTYACSGKDGVNGTNGKDGAPGTTLNSIGQLAGISCTVGGGPGKIALTTSSDGNGTITVNCVPTADTSPRCSAADTPTAVKINELGTFTSSPVRSFVELFNSCSGPVDLGDWTLVYRDTNNNMDPNFPDLPGSDVVLVRFAQGTIVGPGGFIAAGSLDCVACRARLVGILAPAGAAIGLRMPNGLLIDSVKYGTLNVPNSLGEGSPAPNVVISIGRLPDGADTNNNAADFHLMIIATPGSTNPGVAP